MRAVYGRILHRRQELVDIAKSQTSSLKGGQAGAMLDPRRVIGPVRQIRRAKWHLYLKPPDGNTSMLAKVYREAAEALPTAAATERNERLNWLEEMQKSFGKNATRAAIVLSLDSALAETVQSGVGAQNTSQGLQDALDGFRTVHFDATVAAVNALAEGDDPLALLPDYGRGQEHAVSAGRRLRDAAERFLNAVEDNIQSYSADQNSSAGAVSKSISTLETSLGDLIDDLGAMEANHAA